MSNVSVPQRGRDSVQFPQHLCKVQFLRPLGRIVNQPRAVGEESPFFGDFFFGTKGAS